MSVRAISLVLLIACFGCGSNGPERWSEPPEGVEIITNGARADAKPLYRLEATPFRVFDATPLENNLRFGNLSPKFRSDGGLVLVDRHRIGFYDSAGELIATIGREGEGPGEYRDIQGSCMAPGDTLIVHDTGRALISVIDARAGTVVKTMPAGKGHLAWQGCLADGSFLMLRSVVTGEERDRELTWYRLRTDESRSVFFTYAMTDEHATQTGYPSLVAGGALWHFADPWFNEIRSYSLNGALQRIVRFADPVEELTGMAATRSRGVDVAVGSKPARNVSPPSVRLRFFQNIRTIDDGSLWVKDRSDIDLDHDSFTHVGSDGRILGRLILKKNVDGTTVLAGFRPGSVLFQRVDPGGATFVEEFRMVIEG